MRKAFNDTAVGIALALGLFIGGILVASLVGSMPLNDWWTPLAAMGTVAAVIVALWQASVQDRIRHADSLIRANVVAASLAPRLQLLAADLHICCAGLWFSADDPELDTPSARSEKFLGLRPFAVSADDLFALAALGDGCNYQLANAISLLDIAKDEITAEVEKMDKHTPLPEEDAFRWARQIQSVYTLVEIVRRKCVDATDIAVVFPTEQQLWGSDSDG